MRTNTNPYSLRRPRIVVVPANQANMVKKRSLTTRKVASAAIALIVSGIFLLAGFALTSALAEKVIDWRADVPAKEAQEAYADAISERTLSAVSETVEVIEAVRYGETLNLTDADDDLISLPIEEVEFSLAPEDEPMQLVIRTKEVAEFAPFDERCLWVAKTIERQVTKHVDVRVSYELRLPEEQADALGVRSEARARTADTASTDVVLLSDLEPLG